MNRLTIARASGVLLLCLGGMTLDTHAQRRRSFTEDSKGPYWLMRVPPTGKHVDSCLLVRERQPMDTAQGEFVILRMLDKCSELDGPR